jgi:DNA-directed RNA polymerase specialized sigma24 family protein
MAAAHNGTDGPGGTDGHHEPDDPASRLSDIVTNWRDVIEAHNGAGIGRSAQERLIRRYEPAIRRYLLVLVKDPEAADELFQDFSTLLVSGKFQAAAPELGRFRNYIKTTLIHLAHRYLRNKPRHPVNIDREDLDKLAATPEVAESDSTFNQLWVTNLMGRAFKQLEDSERLTGKPLYFALILKIRHPKLRSEALARSMSESHKSPVTEGQFRKMVHQARGLLTEFIVRQVEESLGHPGLDDVEQELIELRLMNACRKVIERRRST